MRRALLLFGLLALASPAAAAPLLGEPKVDRPSNQYDGRWCPADKFDFNGVFVADASVGEYFGRREGNLRDKPLKLFIEDGRVRAASAPEAPALAADVERMLSFGPGSDRVGLVAVGVNYGIHEPTGEALVDQNLPGLHLGIGDPAAQVTGASWTAPTSFAACGAGATVVVQSVPVIVRGKLLTPA